MGYRNYGEYIGLCSQYRDPNPSYNNETELSVVVNLVYLAARDRYRVEREDKSGKGVLFDLFFYPEDRSDTCIF